MNQEPLKFILVVEDDSTFRKLLARAVAGLGYTVREAENGLVAKSIFDLCSSDIQLVISDVRMPELDGLALLKNIRERSDVPFLMMTGFSEILESEEAYRIGANEFLPKPFRTDALKTAIANCFDPLARANSCPNAISPVEEPRYSQIHINEFVTSSKLISDIYVRLAESKYVKVAHEGDAIPMDRLRVYQEKKVNYLYVRIEDFPRYVNFNLKITDIAMSSKSISNSQKIHLMKRTSETIVEQCFINGIEKSLLTSAKQLVEDTVQMVSQDSAVFDLLQSFRSYSDQLYAHSVAVSFYATLVAKQHGWTSSTTLVKTALGGLLHDIGKKEIDPGILSKKRSVLTFEETKVLESHPIRGRDILLTAPGLSEEIALIALQHHERINGSGYPSRLTSEAIHPIAKLIGVIDLFCHHVLPAEEGAKRCSPSEAVLIMVQFHRDEVDMTFLRRLAEVFNVPLDLQALKQKSA